MPSRITQKTLQRRPTQRSSQLRQRRTTARSQVLTERPDLKKAIGNTHPKVTLQTWVPRSHLTKHRKVAAYLQVDSKQWEKLQGLVNELPQVSYIFASTLGIALENVYQLSSAQQRGLT